MCLHLTDRLGLPDYLLKIETKKEREDIFHDSYNGMIKGCFV